MSKSNVIIRNNKRNNDKNKKSINNSSQSAFIMSKNIVDIEDKNIF